MNLQPFVARVRSGRGDDRLEDGLLAALIAITTLGAVSAVGGQINAVLWETSAHKF